MLDGRQFSWALVKEGVHNVTLPVGDADNTRLLENVLILIKLDLALILEDWIDESMNRGSRQILLNHWIEKTAGRTHEEIGLGQHYRLRTVHSQVRDIIGCDQGLLEGR